jgi:hypothetical protein
MPQAQANTVDRILTGSRRGYFEILPNGLVRAVVHGDADYYVRPDGSIHSTQYR